MKVIHYSETPAASVPYVDVSCGSPIYPVAPAQKTNDWSKVTCKRCLRNRPVFPVKP